MAQKAHKKVFFSTLIKKNSKGLPRDAVKICDEVLRDLLSQQQTKAKSSAVEQIAKELNLTA